jgi:hypothetical protein
LIYAHIAAAIIIIFLSPLMLDTDCHIAITLSIFDIADISPPPFSPYASLFSISFHWPLRFSAPSLIFITPMPWLSFSFSPFH